MEPLLAKAAEVERLLNWVVDELAASEVDRIERHLTGIRIHIGDTVFVSPDPEYLLGQAKLHGGPVDVEFFALLNRTYRPSGYGAAGFPVGMQSITNESGCIDFTSGELVDLFSAWHRFQAEHPGRYSASTAKELRRLEDALTERGRCPQDPKLVERELRRLIGLVPEHPVAKTIRQQLGPGPR